MRFQRPQRFDKGADPRRVTYGDVPTKEYLRAKRRVCGTVETKSSRRLTYEDDSEGKGSRVVRGFKTKINKK